MLLTIDANLLNSAINKAIGIINKKSPISLVYSFFLQAKENYLILKATDTEHIYVEKIICNIEQEGQATIKAHTFMDVLKKIKTNIKIYKNNNELIIEKENGKYNIFCSTEEFIDYNIENKNFITTISNTFFLTCLRSFLLSGDNWHYWLSWNNNINIFIASDRKRLIYSKYEFTSNNLEISISKKSIEQIIKILSESVEQEIKIYDQNNQIVIELINSFFIIKKTNEKKIHYEKIIEKINVSQKIDINTKDFINSINNLIPFSSIINKLIKIKFFEKNMKITSYDVSSGFGEENININSEIEGEIALNYQFLLDTLKIINENNIEIYYKDSYSYFFIKNKETIHVIMPFKL